MLVRTYLLFAAAAALLWHQTCSSSPLVYTAKHMTVARFFLQVGQVVETLRACAHQAFPVTPDVVKAYESAEPFDLHGGFLHLISASFAVLLLSYCLPT